MAPPRGLSRHLPCLIWARDYDRASLGADLMAAVIVTIMLIPQSLAYAMLAGLPPEAGIHASILPLILYAIFGTSRVLAVGPVAVISLMTAAAAGKVAASGITGHATAALALAFLSGLMLLAMGIFRLGFLANFLSHPVIAGFITGSGLLIAIGQIGPLSGIASSGQTLPEILTTLWTGIGGFNPATAVIGFASLAFLFWVRRGLRPLLISFGLAPGLAGTLARTGPVLAVVAATLATWGFDLVASGVAVVGTIPRGLPPFTLPSLDPALLRELLLPAALLSLIGFVESVSVAQTLAARRRQRIHPDQELIGLGAANLGAGFSGGFPVTGGFARSVVNADAGAVTPAAGAFTALGLLIAALTLTPLLYFLPRATLAATIILAVSSLIDPGAFRRAWSYSRGDFAALAGTAALTLVLGVEAGVLAGVLLSLVLHLWRSSHPHVAEIGLVAGTQHFRNIRRHEVKTDPSLLMLRIDESLWFANTRFLEDHILARIAESPGLRDVVLMCSAVNEVDMTALEALESLNLQLGQMGVRLHLSEVKGPVMDRLSRSHFLDALSGRVFLCQYDAWAALGARDGAGDPA